MPLIQAKCTNCGATLEVDNTKDAVVCPYCNSAFIVEKAINNYNTTNNITANTVNVFGGSSADFVIRGGVLVKYNGASTTVVIPNSVKRIGDKAFEGCSGITSVTIPNSVTEIGDWAFNGCKDLDSISFPDSISHIGHNAFSGCDRQIKVNISSLSAWLNNDFGYISHNYALCWNGKALSHLVLLNTDVTVIRKHAFFGCTGLASVRIPDRVTIINEFAFCGCTGLTKIVLPSGVKVIKKNAFSGCTGLLDVSIPDSVSVIEDSAFNGCSGLVNMMIPDSITNIGRYAFNGCTGLTKIVLPKSVTKVGYKAFAYCNSLKEITVLNQDIQFEDVSDSDIGEISGFTPEGASTAFCQCPIEQINASDGFKWKHRNHFACLKSQKSGCYIATAVYGSYDAPEVLVLRRFRDEVLQKSLPGRAFIKTYYFLSPPIAEKLKNAGEINAIVRRILDRWVEKLQKR